MLPFMTGATKSRKNPAARTLPLVYRGVQLQRPSARPQVSIARIRKAVEDAIAKNAAALVRDLG
jgi:hypothetical protein